MSSFLSRTGTYKQVAAEAIFEILRELDVKFSLGLDSMHKCQLCRLCLVEGKYGYFTLREGFRMKSARQRCSRSKHSVDKKLFKIMEKPFRLELDKSKEDPGLEAFGEPDIKNKMFEGPLGWGKQIEI